MRHRLPTESGLGKSRRSSGVSASKITGQSTQLQRQQAGTRGTTGVPKAGPRGVRGSAAESGKAGSEANRLGNLTNKREQPRSQPRSTLPNTPKSQGDFGTDRSNSREYLRAVLQRVTSIHRIRRCGTRPVEGASLVTVRWSPDQRDIGGSSFSGLQSCQSWACPTCAARLSIAHQADVHAVLNGADAEGKTIAFLTLTMRHRAGQSLDRLWDASGKGWDSVVRTPAWLHKERGDAKQFGVEGWIRSTEVTQGANGWHVHLHVALILREGVSDNEIQALGSKMFARWQRKLSSLKLTPDNVNGFRIDRAFDAEGIAAYVTKSGQALYGMAAEMALSETKQAAKGSRTTWQILDALRAAEAASDVSAYERELALWLEWEKSQHGRRRLSMSRGLRDKFYLPAETASIETDSETGQSWYAIAGLPRDEWKMKFAKNVPLQHFIREELTRAKRLGHARGIWTELADAMGIDYYDPESDAPLEAKLLPITPEQRRAHAKAEARALLRLKSA